MPFQRHLLQAQPGEMRFRFGWPVDAREAEGGPLGLPGRWGPWLVETGVPSGRACRCTLIPPSGQLPRKPVFCTGWWFIAEQLTAEAWRGRSQAFVKRETSTPFSVGCGDGHTRSGRSHPLSSHHLPENAHPVKSMPSRPASWAEPCACPGCDPLAGPCAGA